MNCNSQRFPETLVRAIAREVRAPSQDRFRPIVTKAALFAALGLAVAPSALAGDTFVVTNNFDSGDGSLRDAIGQANASSGNTVTFGANLKGSTITLTTGSMTISKPMTITGPGTNLLTVSGSHQSRIFYANTKPTSDYVEISDMTLTAGNAAGFSGGAIACSHCLIKMSHMDINSSNAAFGGGLSVFDGTLILLRSRVSGNNAAFVGGGMTLNSSEVGIGYATVSGNTAGQYGAGIYVANTSSLPFSLLSSTVDSNTIPDPGGPLTTAGAGIAFHNAPGSKFVYNSTIAQNYVYGSGAGIATLDSASTANFTIAYSTIATNFSAQSSGNGIRTVGVTAVKVANSIVSGNSSHDGVSDLYGTFNLYGDLIQNKNDATISISTGNIFGVDAQLGALGDHGGTTRTMVPDSASMAIDVSTCGPAILDQRKFGRCVNGKTDIGAVERQSPEPIIFRDGFSSG